MYTPNSIQKDQTKLLPEFYYTDRYLPNSNDESNLWRHFSVLSSELTELFHQKLNVANALKLNRPITIIREPLSLEEFNLHVNLNIGSISNIKCYINDEEIVFENISDFNNEKIVFATNDVFRISVTTADGFVFEKGFPENDILKNNVFDHDFNLDLIGKLIGVPRFKYEVLKESDFEDYSSYEEEMAKTLPKYCLYETEEDWHYLNRISNYIISFWRFVIKSSESQSKIPLSCLEFWKSYGVLPELTNRTVHVHKQNVDGHFMWNEAMEGDDEYIDVYMATKDYWNSNVYDMHLDYEKLPSNLPKPSTKDLVSILRKYTPITKRVIYNINLPSYDKNMNTGIKEHFQIRFGSFIIESSDPYSNFSFSASDLAVVEPNMDGYDEYINEGYTDGDLLLSTSDEKKHVLTFSGESLYLIEDNGEQEIDNAFLTFQNDSIVVSTSTKVKINLEVH